MAASTIRRHDLEKCLLCGKGVMHNQDMRLHRLSLETFQIDLRAIQQTAGLEMHFGGGGAGAMMANVMGADPDLATSTAPAQSFLVCDTCYRRENITLAVLRRLLDDRQNQKG